MPNSKVYEPTTWKHIRAAYKKITEKLNSVSGPENKAVRLEAIDYCWRRLAEDRVSIDAGGNALDPPADEPEN